MDSASPSSGRPPAQADAPRLFQMIRSLVTAQGWSASKRVVQENPDLLSADADELMAELIGRSDVQSRALFTDLRGLLQACFDHGIDAAFAPRLDAERLRGMAFDVP